MIQLPEDLEDRIVRLMPYDAEAEQSALAALAIGDASIRTTMRCTISSTDFYQEDHRIMFTVLCDLIDRGGEVDMVTLRSELKRRNQFEEVGGNNYLASLLHTLPGIIGHAGYAESVRDCSVRRRLIEQSLRGIRAANGLRIDQTADDVAREMMDGLSSILASGRATEYWTLESALQEAVDDLDKTDSPLLTTGFPSLDAQCSGIGEGEMMVVAARPSMGKSTLLRQQAVRIAKAGIPVGFISLEEDRKKIARNVLSAEAMIENRKIRNRDLTKEDANAIASAVSKLSKLPIYGSHNKTRKLNDIVALTHLWKQRHGVRIVFVDYLQRINGGRGESRYEQVSDVSLRLSDLWKEVGVGAVVAAQLNRKNESREDKRPNMGDLRDSGQIEQDADAIVFLHREDYYHTDDENYQKTQEAELILAKWRDSARGEKVILYSDMRYQTFYDPMENKSGAVHFRPPTAIQDPFE